jgi:hypothetical protein
MTPIQPVIPLPSRGPRSYQTKEEWQIDFELIRAIHDWFRIHNIPHRNGGRYFVTNSWVNRYSNATYKEFRSMVESLIVLITKINLMQLPRKWHSPLSRLISSLRDFLVQTHSMLDKKHQLHAWQQRGWITHE